MATTATSSLCRVLSIDVLQFRVTQVYAASAGPVHHFSAPSIAICHLYVESMEDLRAVIATSDAAMADIPNFTNVEPVMQTSRVVN